MARIMIVDDEEMDRFLLGRLLDDQGHEVVFATGSEGALRLWLDEPADLVVTDIAMPELDGVGLIRVLRKNDPWVRVIAISGAGPSKLDAAGEVGAVATLSKPVDPEELLEAIEKALEGHGHWRDVARE